MAAESALLVRELNHVALYVRDMDTSVRFYGEVLGLPLCAGPATLCWACHFWRSQSSLFQLHGLRWVPRNSI